MIFSDIKCLKCGASYFMKNYSTCTAIYFPPIYENGVNINPDRNITTTVYTCLNCFQIFSYQECADVISISN